MPKQPSYSSSKKVTPTAPEMLYSRVRTQGWFPAKLVEVLDERSKRYSFAGDDSVSQAVTDLVRGGLCPAIKRILEHGLRR